MVFSLTSFLVRKKDCGFTNSNRGPENITNVILIDIHWEENNF